MFRVYSLALLVLALMSPARAEDAPGKVAFGAIVGTVVTAEGKPVPDAAVNLYIAPANPKKADVMGTGGKNNKKRGGGGGKQGAGISIATATTDMRGSFVMASVAVGEYVLDAR